MVKVVLYGVVVKNVKVAQTSRFDYNFGQFDIKQYDIKSILVNISSEFRLLWTLLLAATYIRQNY